MAKKNTAIEVAYDSALKNHKNTFTAINLRSYIFLILVAYLNEC